jgi:hypothetical protein
MVATAPIFAVAAGMAKTLACGHEWFHIQRRLAILYTPENGGTR